MASKRKVTAFTVDEKIKEPRFQAVSIACALLVYFKVRTWGEIPVGLHSDKQLPVYITPEQMDLMIQHERLFAFLRGTIRAQGDKPSAPAITLAYCDQCLRFVLAGRGGFDKKGCMLTHGCQGSMVKVSAAKRYTFDPHTPEQLPGLSVEEIGEAVADAVEAEGPVQLTL